MSSESFSNEFQYMINECFNNSNDVIFFINEESSIIFSNKKAIDSLGYSEEELGKKKIFEIASSKHRSRLEKLRKNILKKGQLQEELELICKDGSILEIEFRSKLIEIDKERFILTVGRDISKRKQVEEEQKLSDEKYRLLFSEMSSAFAYHKMIYDEDGKPIDFEFLRVNHSYEKILNLTSKEIIGKKVTKIFPMIASGENNLIQKFGEVAKFGKKLQSDMFFKTTKKWYSISAYSPEKDHFAVIFEDITTRKKTEKELRLKNQAIATSINAIVITDLEGRLTYINLTFLEMWGFSDKTEVLGRHLLEFWYDTNGEADKIIRLLQTQGKWIGELVAKKKDETLFDIQLSTSMVFDEEGVPINMMSSFIDITEGKKTEKRLKESEQRISHIMEGVPIGIALSDFEGNIIDANSVLWKMLGLESKEAFLQTNAKEFYYDQKDRKAFVEQLEIEGKVQELVCQKQRKDGSVFWCSLSSVVGQSVTGERRLITTFKDIAERKKAEIALEESEELLLSVINNSPFGYSLEDNEGKILRVNPALIKMLGYSTKELLDTKLEDITPEEHKVKTRELTQKFFNKEISVGEIEKIYIKKDGSLIPVKVTIWQLYTAVDKPSNLIRLIEDITDREKNEREKEEAYKKINELNEQLKVINTILRHDIRNNLVVTNGSIDAFLDSNKESFLHMAKKTTTKSENLIDKMKEVEEIITKGDRELVKVDVRNITEEVISNYAGIGIQFDLKGKGIAQADVALGSVIDNIVGNALKHSETDTISITINSSKDSCVIEIADSGKGIPDDFKKKLFEHGFRFGSTAGTGLGLYIVKKTIDQYGGSIKVKNNLPKGTIFEIELKKA